MTKIIRYSLLLCGVLAGLTAWSQKKLPEPTQFLVNDYAGILSREQVVALGQKLRDYANETSTQIVVITETSLEGEDPFDYTNRLARAWGIGGKENDNGILLYIARDDRQIRIQTGYGAEGFLPDAMSKRIIDQIIVPAFRQGKFYEGIDQAVSAMMDLGRGEGFTNEKPKGNSGGGGSALAFLFVVILFFLIMMWLVRRRHKDDDDNDDGGYDRGGRYRGHRRRGGGGWIFFPGPGGWNTGGGGSSDRGADGWGGFGGGGFGGFGGGDFGGGGAGGSW